MVSNNTMNEINKKNFSLLVDYAFNQLKDATLFNDKFARLCLGNREVLKEVINNTLISTRLFTQDKLVEEIVNIAVQSLQVQANGREIIYDIFCKDKKGRYFDVEIQLDPNGMPPERVRYYAAALDVQALKPKQDYKNLKESYVIVFFRTDPRSRGKLYYLIERCYMDDKEQFNDGSHIVYINAQDINFNESLIDQKELPLAKVIHALNAKDPDEIQLPTLAKHVKLIKSNKENFMRTVESVFPNYLIDSVEDMRQRDRQEGRIEGKESIAYNLLKEGFSIEKVMQLTGLSKQRIEELAVSIH